MSTKLLNIDAYAARLARRLGVAAGLILATVISVIVAMFAFSYYGLVVEKAFSTHSESFGFWVQVNDRYQLQRVLAGIVESQGLEGAIVLGSEGNVIAQKGEESVIQQLRGDGAFAIGPKGILLRYHFKFHETAAVSRLIGRATMGLTVPYTYILFCLLGSALVVSVAVQATQNSFSRIAAKMTKPVRELADSVAAAKSLNDLRAIDSGSVGFAELQLLTAKIGEMSERLVDQEAIIQKSERAKEIFILGRQVAHDIRSPISALRMAVDSAKELDGERRALIVSVAERIDRIASDLLHRSRIKYSPPGFNLVEACEQIVIEKKTALSATKVDLRVKAEREAPAVVGDANEFQRVLSNLINNSIESLPSYVYVDIQSRDDKTAVVRISDNGRGIDSGTLFEIRRGLEVSTKPDGNGLGLAHARHVLHKWGGEFDISSAAGKGTTVTLTLPFVPSV